MSAAMENDPIEVKAEVNGKPRAKLAKVLDAHIESGFFVAEDIWQRQHKHPLEVQADPLDSAAIEDVAGCPFECRRPMKQVEMDAQEEAVEQFQQALKEADKQGSKTLKWVAVTLGAVVVAVAIVLVVVLKSKG